MDREKEQGRREGGGRVQRNFGAVGTQCGEGQTVSHCINVFQQQKKHIYLFIRQEKKHILDNHHIKLNFFTFVFRWHFQYKMHC